MIWCKIYCVLTYGFQKGGGSHLYKLVCVLNISGMRSDLECGTPKDECLVLKKITIRRLCTPCRHIPDCELCKCVKTYTYHHHHYRNGRKMTPLCTIKAIRTATSMFYLFHEWESNAMGRAFVWGNVVGFKTPLSCISWTPRMLWWWLGETVKNVENSTFQTCDHTVLIK